MHPDRLSRRSSTVATHTNFDALGRRHELGTDVRNDGSDGGGPVFHYDRLNVLATTGLNGLANQSFKLGATRRKSDAMSHEHGSAQQRQLKQDCT